MALARGALVALLLVSCSGCPGRGDVDPRLLGRLIIVSDPPEALIFVDDRYLGTVRGLRGRALALRPGTRRLEVRREGYFAFYADVKIARGVRKRLVIKLRKEPF